MPYQPYLGPVVALIAGILILIQPGLLSIIVAVYLIVIGILGLMGARPRGGGADNPFAASKAACGNSRKKRNKTASTTLSEEIAMNRITQISAGLAIGLFIAMALAIFPVAAAPAQSGETPGIMQTVQYNEESEGRVYSGTLDIRIQSETRGLPPGRACAHRSFRRHDGS